MWAPDKNKSSINLGVSPIIEYIDAPDPSEWELPTIRREVWEFIILTHIP